MAHTKTIFKTAGVTAPIIRKLHGYADHVAPPCAWVCLIGVVCTIKTVMWVNTGIEPATRSSHCRSTD